MALADRIKSSDPTRFVGRRAANCRKCGSAVHYVNRVGGVVCRACQPPESEQDCLITLECVNGFWAEPWGDASQASDNSDKPAEATTDTPTPAEQLIRSRSFGSWLDAWSRRKDAGGSETITRIAVAPLASHWPRRSEAEHPLILCRAHERQLFWKPACCEFSRLKAGDAVHVATWKDGKRTGSEKKVLKPVDRLRDYWVCGVCHPPVSEKVVKEWIGR
ncbi:hypothetical protein GYB59_00615 [bacterium]|nr:hypothetical protein [bacterium]